MDMLRATTIRTGNGQATDRLSSSGLGSSGRQREVVRGLEGVELAAEIPELDLEIEIDREIDL